MRDATTILDIIRARSERGLPLEDAYRILYNPTLYLYAYGRISANRGAMTPGVTADTADGISLETINALSPILSEKRIDGNQCVGRIF